MTRAGTIPLSDIEWVKIYFNSKRLRSTTNNLKRMLAETGGDFMMNAAIFLRSLKPCCHLKADGVVKCKPNYTAWGISWNTAADITVKGVGVETVAAYSRKIMPDWGGVVAVALIAVYFAGYLNPNLMVVDIEGQTVNLMTAVSLVMLAAFTAYAVDVIKKLKDMITSTTPGSNDPTPPSEPVELEESPDVDERVKIKEEDEHDTADPSN